MCIGTDFVMLGADMIKNPIRRNEIITRFEDSGREVIMLSSRQIAEFCGNALELQSDEQRLLALSQRAYNAMETEQRKILEKSVTLLPLEVSAIETAGGSIRCMLAGIHLAPRPV